MKKALLRLLGSTDHQFVTRSELNSVNDKLDAIIKHENIKFVSLPTYEIKESKGIGFDSKEQA